MMISCVLVRILGRSRATRVLLIMTSFAVEVGVVILMTMRICIENSVYYKNQFLCRRRRISLFYSIIISEFVMSTFNELFYTQYDRCFVLVISRVVLILVISIMEVSRNSQTF